MCGGVTPMKKTAILVDGEFFSIALRHNLNLVGRLSAAQIYKHAHLLVDAANEEVWRIFYYDSRPYAGHERHPVTGKVIDFANTPLARARERFLNELGQMDLVALRCGETRPRGWQLSETYLKRLAQSSLIPPPSAADYELRFEQKGVDMRIGIDVATLSLNRYVDRIVIASNDTDLVPALKIARRYGVQIVIAQIGTFNPHHDLIEDADFRRVYSPAA
jgi:uncharacterized LabA/DUF88 family protein